jgi:hypothetical protein
MYLCSRTRIDIIDKFANALSVSTLSTTALPAGVHEARQLGLPALLLAFPRFLQ